MKLLGNTNVNVMVEASTNPAKFPTTLDKHTPTGQTELIMTFIANAGSNKLVLTNLDF